MLKTLNSEFSFIETWFINQNNKPLKIEDKGNLMLIMKYIYKHKINYEIFNTTKRTKLWKMIQLFIVSKKIC